jgi:hypothetical protein
VNHLSGDRFASKFSIQRNQPIVYVEEHDPEFTEDSPDQVADKQNPSAGADVIPSQPGGQTTCLQTPGRPYRQAQPGSGEREKADKVDDFDEIVGDVFLK